MNAFPWHWTPAMVDEWLGDLRSLRELKRSTIRSYSEAVRAFCHFITDPLYEWTATCQERFGTHPVQVVHEWNTAVHVQDDEADAMKRAFTKAELHGFFAHCDDEVERIRAFGRNPYGAEFGEYGRCLVRFGKAKKGSPPKRRGVLTVFDWTPDVLDEWFTEVRPLFGNDNNPAAWPSERGLRIVQEQVGHEHASTTSLYTCVSSDFRTRTLWRHLDSTIAAALQTQTGRQA
ncbi:hypothetical protein [Streptomyces sp. NPDC090022]|uniref:hypothetical protein n=1 Tax=Streptomyces sp. NPDC090022 TaxID=3365920 RepID=UPI00382FF9C6